MLLLAHKNLNPEVLQLQDFLLIKEAYTSFIA